MSLSRRSILKLGAGAVAMWATGATLRAAADKKIPIGLQLYSVRNQCEKDLPGVLAAVKKMGYQGVEFAGYYGRNAKDLRKLLDDNGLVCCGTHTGFDTVTGDNLKRTIEYNQTIGNKFLIVPSLPRGREDSAEACKATGKLFTDIAEKAKPDGMRVGYHAHGGDFVKFNGETAWDLIFSNASPEVVMQLDIGNCLDGNGDPYAILRKFPGRATTIHIKEHGGPRGAVIGEGTMRWQEIFDLVEKPGGTEWYIVEHESDPTNPLGSVQKCVEALRKMGK